MTGSADAPAAMPAETQIPAEARTPHALRDDLRDFFGPNAEPYLRAYDRKMASLAKSRRGNFLGFSLAALLVPLPWLMYRKMYIAAGGFLFAALLIGLLLPDAGASFSVAGICGAMGKALYVAHAEGKIRKIDGRHLSPSARTDLIRRAGGVSWLSAAIGIVIMAGTIAAMIAAHGQRD